MSSTVRYKSARPHGHDIADQDHRSSASAIHLATNGGANHDGGEGAHTDDEPDLGLARPETFEVARKVHEQEERQAREEAEQPGEHESSGQERRHDGGRLGTCREREFEEKRDRGQNSRENHS